MRVTIQHEIETRDILLDVAFTAEVSPQGTRLGMAVNPSGAELDTNITWNKKKFKNAENVLIEDYLASNSTIIEDELIEEFLKQYWGE
jgi:hypothetical protein